MDARDLAKCRTDFWKKDLRSIRYDIFVFARQFALNISEIRTDFQQIDGKRGGRWSEYQIGRITSRAKEEIRLEVT